MILTFEDFLEIMKTNSKENPLNLNNYDKQSVLDARLQKSDPCHFYIRFNCCECGKEVEKVIHRKHKCFMGFISFCPNCLRKHTDIEKYGVEHHLSSKKVIQKREKTNKLKYGCTNVFQNEEIKNKIKSTNLVKYGAEHISQTERFKAKTRNTNLTKYGVEYISQVEEVKEKVKKTNLLRRGVEYPTQSEEVRKKVKITLKSKYGVDNISQVPETREKFKKTMVENYGTIHQKHIYHFDGLNFDSSWEVAFYIYNKDKNILIERNIEPLEYYFNEEKHLYFPDFKIGDNYFEVKGEQFLSRDNNGNITGFRNAFGENNQEQLISKYNCILEHKVEIIDKFKIKQYLDYIAATYGKKYLEGLKKNN